MYVCMYVCTPNVKLNDILVNSGPQLQTSLNESGIYTIPGVTYKGIQITWPNLIKQ